MRYVYPVHHPMFMVGGGLQIVPTSPLHHPAYPMPMVMHGGQMQIMYPSPYHPLTPYHPSLMLHGGHLQYAYPTLPVSPIHY